MGLDTWNPSVRSKHVKTRGIANLPPSFFPFLAFEAAVRSPGATCQLARPRDPRRHVFRHAIGITIGYHRLFTHRAFDTPRPVIRPRDPRLDRPCRAR